MSTSGTIISFAVTLKFHCYFINICMKNMLFTTLISTVIMSIIILGLSTHPASAFPDDYNNPPMHFVCYHKVDGVLDPNPYAAPLGGRPCPPWSSSPGAAEIDQKIDLEKSANGLPPHLCQEVISPVY